MGKLKNMPEFKTEAEEHDFWKNHDSVDYVDWTRAQPALLPNLKPSTVELRQQVDADVVDDL